MMGQCYSGAGLSSLQLGKAAKADISATDVTRRPFSAMILSQSRAIQHLLG